MKLSKQERIAVLVIAVIIILGVGIFLFIVPKFEAIGASNESLATKQQELSDAQARAATMEQLGNDVIEAYNEGRNIADMFFEEMQPYEADAAVRDFIDYCKNTEVTNDAGEVIKKKLNITVDSLTIGTPATSTLSVSFFSEPTVTYDLKTYATQGEEATEEELAAQQREALMQEALATAQTVGSIEASFTVSALDEDELMAFIDAVNEYQKEEDGGTLRKALRVTTGLNRTYADVEEKYADYIEEISEDVTSKAESQYEKETGKKLNSTDTQTTTATNTDSENTNGENAEEEKDEEVGSIEDSVYSIGVTIVFYSIERMEDPTDQLAAQNAM